MTIVAAADGSALGNPGPAGWAWYVDNDCWRAGGWPHGTNNMGELMAVLDLFKSTAHRSEEPLRILCDSQYVINAVTKWMPGWKRKGWRKADGKPVLNVDLLKEIDAAIVGRTYSFEWVKGHAGHDLNEAADDRARAAATAYQGKRTPEAGPGFPGQQTGEGNVGNADDAVNPGNAVTSPTSESLLTAPSTASANRGTSDVDQPDLFSLFDDDADDDDPSFGAQEANKVENVIALERELLDPDVRADALRVAELLHPDFTEIGSSGRQSSRAEIIDAMSNEVSSPVTLDVLELNTIAANTVLLVYRSERSTGTALRSSLWQLNDNRWQLRFHQGTLVP